MTKQTNTPSANDVEALTLRGLPLADRIAYRLTRRMNGMLELDDAKQMGRVALVEAAQRYDASRGVPFELWAARRVHGAIVDGLSAHTGFSRAHVRAITRHSAAAAASTGTHERLRYTMGLFAKPNSQKELRHQQSPSVNLVGGDVAQQLIDHHYVSGPLQDPVRRNTQSEEAQIAKDIIEGMVTEERSILTGHYLEGKSLSAIGEARGTSRSWMSRLHKRAVEQAQRKAQEILSLEMPRERE